MQNKMKGKLVVIEGGDGSGKGTQTQLLVDYLHKHSVAHAYVDFPNYDSFFGNLIAKFLRGELGDLDSVSPYLASLPFALDRNASKGQIDKELEAGKVVIANRYVSSNMAHQGSKFDDINKRDEFLDWLDELEFGVHGLPRPDVVIYLHMPWEVAHELTNGKEKREYLNGKQIDIQEADKDHRQKTEALYNRLATEQNEWITIACTKNDTILARDDIHQKIVDVLRSHAIIT